MPVPSQIQPFLTRLPLEAPYVALFLVMASIYGLTLGRSRSLVPVLALYIGAFFSLHLPLVAWLNQWLSLPPSPTLPAIWLTVFAVLSAILLRRSPHVQDLLPGEGTWWEAILFAMLFLGLAMTLYAQVLPPALVQRWPGMIPEIFLSQAGRTFWLVSPLVFAAFLRPSYGTGTLSFD